MSHKNDRMWTIHEAAHIADILDKRGAYTEANLLDQYIEAAAEGDITKQAGLWDRFKGWAKSKFISEYGELVREARQAQKGIDENLALLNENHKAMAKDLKNYRLKEWRIGVQDVNQQITNIKELVFGFDQAYGKFLNVVVGVEKLDPTQKGQGAKGKKPSEMVSQIFGPGQEEVFGPDGEPSAGPDSQKQKAEDVVKADITGLVDNISEWSSTSKKNSWLSQQENWNKIRVSNEKMKQLGSHVDRNISRDVLLKLDPSGQKRLIRFNTDATGKLPSWILPYQDKLVASIWEYTGHDEWYTYFQKAQSDDDKEDMFIEPADPPTQGEGFEAKPRLQEVPPEDAEGDVEPEEIEELSPEHVSELSPAGPPPIPGSTPPPIPGSTPPPVPEVQESPLSKRQMGRQDRGEILARPKDGGRLRWVTKDKFDTGTFDEATKEEYEKMESNRQKRLRRQKIKSRSSQVINLMTITSESCSQRIERLLKLASAE